MVDKTTLGLVLLLLCLCALAQAKQASHFVTAAMRANALRNAEKYPWAAAARRNAVAAAEPWLKLSDDQLWQLVTSQELPRAVYIAAGILYEGKQDACPRCGKPLSYQARVDFWKQDWKVTCPACGERFPKNDFAAYYRTALDEHGFFRRGAGDKALLYNTEHPDPTDPLHNLYVDDGYGLTDEKGNKHHVVAYYNYAAQWTSLLRGLTALSQAYALTSDARYAHKAAVLLDRIADVYPEMDYDPLGRLGFQHSHGGSLQGRVQGNIWETMTADAISRAYDLVFDGIQEDRELVSFCAARSAQYHLGDKSTTAALCAHLEDHLLLEFLKSVKDGRIDGNTGMTHLTLATAALALDRPGLSGQWLDWLFAPDYPVTNPNYPRTKDPVPWVMVEGLDGDGMGGECGGYGLIWTGGMIKLAALLAGYPAYTHHDLLSEYPKLRQCFLVYTRLNVLGAAMPNVGDTGACGSWGRVGDPHLFALGYKLLRDPRLAALAWRYAAGEPRALSLEDDIYEADPEALAREIAAAAGEMPRTLVSDHLGRYGQAYLQTEQAANGRALWLNYGYDKGHSHHDCLTMGLLAKNLDLLPDHGYPEFTGDWPQRLAWTSNTASHNTLLVGDQRSAYSPGGKLELFAVQPPLRVMAAASPQAYPKLRTYRRTLALVDVSADDSYAVDVFRARGGRNHRLIYCGPAPAASVTGLSLAPQPSGTFAGPTVGLAALPAPGETNGTTNGFSYLYDVARSGAGVEQPYTVDWKAEDLRGRLREGREPHLRVHALTPSDEVALASGQPPQNKSGNPASLRYLIQSRLGDDLESVFVNVLEPYDGSPFIRAVRRLRVEGATDPTAAVALAVDLTDGRTDVIISCERAQPLTVEGGLEFCGVYGLVRLQGGQVKTMRMLGGTLLAAGGVRLTSAVAAYTGTVKAVDVSDPADNRVTLEPPLPALPALVGQTIHFGNALPQDTSYTIRALRGDAVSTGEISLIQGFRNPADFTAGYKLLVNAGDRYSLPAVAGLDR